jgi:hypothetical protein
MGLTESFSALIQLCIACGDLKSLFLKLVFILKNLLCFWPHINKTMCDKFVNQNQVGLLYGEGTRHDFAFLGLTV